MSPPPGVRPHRGRTPPGVGFTNPSLDQESSTIRDAHLHPQGRTRSSATGSSSTRPTSCSAASPATPQPCCAASTSRPSPTTSTPATSSSSSTPRRWPSPARSSSRRRPTATRATRAASRPSAYAELLEKNPVRAVEKAVRGMLPKNSLGRAQLHEAQGLRRPRAPARCPAAQDRTPSPGRPVSAGTPTFSK